MWASLVRSASCLGLGVFFGVACTGPGPATTETMESESIGCPIGSEGCACTPGGTCDEPLVCASKVCVSNDATTGPGTTTDATTGTETSNGTVAGECSPPDDRPNVQCMAQSADTPYCNSKGLCADCTGISSCAAIDAATPACDADSGQCVECTAIDAGACGDAEPVCDVASQTCRQCRAHADCSKSACDLDTGACYPADEALWVDGGAACDDAAAGTEDAPLCTVKRALEIVGEGALSARRAVLVRSGKYTDALVVPDGHTVAIVRAGTGTVDLLGKGTQGLSVGAGSTLLLGDVTIRGNTMGDGIRCKSGSLRLDGVWVAGHKVSGLASDTCTVRAYASVLTGNGDQGLLVSGGSVLLVNSFVTDNGGSVEGLPQGGLALDKKAKADIICSTFVGNAAYIGGGSSVECLAGATPTIKVHDSILFNASGATTFNCGDIEAVDHSALSQDMDDLQDTNAGIPPADAPGLVAADPKAEGVYRPKDGTELEGVASIDDGDPAVDFDGDPRLKGPGVPGADQP